MFGLEKLFGGGNQSSASSYADSSTNTNTEVSGSAVNASGGANVVRDNGTLFQGDMTVNNDMSIEAVLRAFDSADINTNALKEIALGSIGASSSAVKSVTDSANTYVQGNAELAARSMDTALEFARNAKPASATFTDAIPIIAIAGAIALIGVAVIRNRK